MSRFIGVCFCVYVCVCSAHYESGGEDYFTVFHHVSAELRLSVSLGVR